MTPQEAGTGSVDENPPRNVELTFQIISGYPTLTTTFSIVSSTDAMRGWCLAGTSYSMLSTRARLPMMWQRRRGDGGVTGAGDTGSTGSCWITASDPTGVKIAVLRAGPGSG